MPRISQLPALTTADNSDEIAIVDTSASVTKKITRGDLLKAPLPANAVTTPSITDGAVTASKIDFATLGDALVLGYVQKTTSFIFGSVVSDNTGMSLTFTTTVSMPVTIEFWASQVMTGQVGATRVDTYITDNSNTVLAASYPAVTSTLPSGAFSLKKSYESLPAGTYTFKVRNVTPAGTGTIYAGSESPMFLKAYVG